MNVSSGRSDAPTPRHDHNRDTSAFLLRYGDSTTNNTYLPFRGDSLSRPDYVPRPTDDLGNLQPVTRNAANVRPMRPASYHDPYPVGRRAIPGSNSGERPLPLVPMDNPLVAHHPFPRDIQDEHVLRVFIPRP